MRSDDWQYSGVRRLAVLLIVAMSGCSTTRLTDTPRTGLEQLLVSNAIDSSLDRIEFTGLTGAAIFVDDKYLDCVDKKYVVGSVRQRAFQAGARLVEKPDEADMVLEIHSGAVGTDRTEGFVGLPGFNLPGPFPMQLPEVKLLSRSSQYGTAKIGVIAYDPKTKQALASGGLARARSTNSIWSILGVGPLNVGSLRDEIKLTKKQHASESRILLSNRPFRISRLPNLPTHPHQALNPGVDTSNTAPPFNRPNQLDAVPASIESNNPGSAQSNPDAQIQGR